MAQHTALQGKVLNAQGSAIPGALVEVLNTPYTAVTAADGAFNLLLADSGSYLLHASAMGFAAQAVAAAVPAQAPLVIVLEKNMAVLDEVVVTAQKRSEALQQVPLSVSTLSAKEISDYRLWNVGQLSGIVPTLYAAHPGDYRNVTAIRGITSTSYDPAVVTYVDGVNQFNLDTYMPELLDVERIEVLRGPQSTLYGRNALGGVINIITKQPTFTTTGFAEANVGNYGLQRYRAGIKTPLSGKLLFGAALLYNRLDGYFTNEFNNSHYDKQASFGGNYFLKYIPSGALSFTLNVKHQYNKNNGPFPLVFGADNALQNPYKLSQDATAQMKDQLLNGSLAVKYSGKHFQLTSETGYQSNYRYYNQALDGDFSPADAIGIYNNYGRDWNKVTVFTEELRISSPAGRQQGLTWVGGTYLFAQQSPVRQATVFGRDAGLLGSPDSLFRIINSSTARNRGIAFFGQATLPLTQKIKLTGGLRYDYQHNRLAVQSTYSRDDVDFSFPLQADTSGTTRYHAFSPKLGLQFLLSPQHNAYISYSRGYRTGGLTSIGADPSQPALYPYAPEYSSNYEAGLKNSFFGNKLRLNVSVFYIRVKDIQIPTLVLPDAITITRNGGRLTSKGAEAELAAALWKGLQIQYSLGYTHARYNRLVLPQDGAEKDFSGNRQVFTPDVTSQLAAQYSLPLASTGSLQAVVRGEWFYFGTQYFNQANTIQQAPYHLLNTRFGLSHARGELMFWMRNIARKKYIDFAYDFGGVHLGNPQTYGVTFLVRFS